jgi:hypothetical protein
LHPKNAIFSLRLKIFFLLPNSFSSILIAVATEIQRRIKSFQHKVSIFEATFRHFEATFCHFEATFRHFVATFCHFEATFCHYEATFRHFFKRISPSAIFTDDCKIVFVLVAKTFPDSAIS